jgi:hypothetical protein
MIRQDLFLRLFLHLFLLPIAATSAVVLLPSAAKAERVYYHDGVAVGMGYNIASENYTLEDFAFSLKYRMHHWQGGIDYCFTGPVGGGNGDSNLQFLWVSYIEEFSRPDTQKYGLYGGIGVGGMVGMDYGFLERRYGPFALAGWDITSYLGIEGKAGLFGRNNWGTGMLYWYF